AILATVPAGDTRSEGFLAEALKPDDDGFESGWNVDATCSLHRLQKHLFADTAPAEQRLDDSVMLRSAAGEMQECVEVARRIQAEVRRGVRFDQ
ncbi:hypothetical protein, partial [Klebsiella pneumoniae]|uniref:hypothetical protein n=1 Tax=Klebsiella pneumoniae TaxID=573 RepID=UPI003013B4ED